MAAIFTLGAPSLTLFRFIIQTISKVIIMICGILNGLMNLLQEASFASHREISSQDPLPRVTTIDQQT